MKKLLLLVFLFSFAGYAQSHDKLLHFGAGVVSGAAGAFVAHEISGGDKWWSIAGAVGGSLIAGTVKEVIDKNRYGTWDNGDLAATAAGGVTVGIAIEIFSGSRKRRTVKIPGNREENYTLTADPFKELSQNQHAGD